MDEGSEANKLIFWAQTLFPFEGKKGFFSTIEEIVEMIRESYCQKHADYKSFIKRLNEERKKPVEDQEIISPVDSVPILTTRKLLKEYVNIINIENSTIPPRKILRDNYNLKKKNK